MESTGKFGLPWDRIQQWRDARLSIVATDGCFDILHVGHLRMLQWAKQQGDRLVVLLPDDASIAVSKPGRPFVGVADRVELVSALKPVDAAGWYQQAELANLYAELRPDVMVNSPEWAGRVVGQAEVEESGGRIALFPIVPGRSTSDIISKIPP
jgi:D-beta-D-heptose 7-phosphate kinase/D-beta-D-heptose 1-phosphate adenosyltransferase